MGTNGRRKWMNKFFFHPSSEWTALIHIFCKGSEIARGDQASSTYSSGPPATLLPFLPGFLSITTFGSQDQNCQQNNMPSGSASWKTQAKVHKLSYFIFTTTMTDIYYYYFINKKTVESEKINDSPRVTQLVNYKDRTLI